MSGTLVRNTNHVISDTQSNFRPNGGRLLPDAPVNLTSNRSRIRQPAFSLEKLLSPKTTPAIRAKLVALDHRGFRTVVIEKMNPGPFGFYIATGVINQRRGIFISRVSLPSLMPVLSVGDELIYVENELIKGRTLEYVQSLIAGKNVVTILLLPNTSSALC
uniref:PDZ domain-containing protein n=1 Tax=Syphacia muris TaxID=451379 RepID=A0A0N5AJV5_9BILA